MEMNLKKEFDQRSYIGHFVLESERKKIVDLASTEGFDITKCDVVLTINGIQLRNEKFSELIDHFVERILDSREEYMKDLRDEQEIKRRIEEGVKEKFYELINKVEWGE